MRPVMSFVRSRQAHVLCQGLLAVLIVVAHITGNAVAEEGKVSPEVPAVLQPVEPTDDIRQVRPIRTDSPRQTLRTLIDLRANLEADIAEYVQEKSPERTDRLILLLDRLSTLTDLSLEPPTRRHEIGIDTVGFLLDIFGRIEMPNLDDVPDAAAFSEDGSAKYRIPKTPIRIVRLTEGSRSGEFLFSAQTVKAAPRFAEVVSSLPLRSSLGITSWSEGLKRLTGWMIPIWLESAIPNDLNRTWLDTPIWKIAAVLIISFVALIVLIFFHRLVVGGYRHNRVVDFLVLMLSPLAALLAVQVLVQFFTYQIAITGLFAAIVDFSTTIAAYVARMFLFALAVAAVFEWIILSPRIADESLNASMLRLLAKIIAIIGGAIILAYGAQQLGLPVFSIVAGFGIGGLAIALAVRPTLENLIGGFILYLDKPVSVGDFCQFGERLGHVENIGVRSTQIRSLDQTLISIPNAQFADMELTNWAHCDEMLMGHVIGLRYETDADQLRHVLAKSREMLHAHPKITSETVRMRFIGYGTSSLDIELRVYAKTGEWDEFYAIQEDVLLRLKDIVEASGTGFAFPSLTLYANEDKKLDAEIGDYAKQEVAAWRSSQRLPFPRFSASHLASINDTLDYPPRGSHEFHAETPEFEGDAEYQGKTEEQLSGEPLGQSCDEDDDVETKKR